MLIAGQFAFWLLVLSFCLTWILYPLVMNRLGAWSSSIEDAESVIPIDNSDFGVSVILPVYNGEGRIVEKLKNILALERSWYPMEILVVSDGSTDRTLERIRELKSEYIRVFALEDNAGKSAAQNVAVAAARYPIVLFTDVGADLDKRALDLMVQQFSDSRVGCVGANVQYHGSGWEVSASHSTYWRMEEAIRVAESKLGVLISVCGSAFAIRKSLFRTLDADTGDDFIIPMDIALQGYRTVLAKDALVYDRWPSSTYFGELQTRRRITLRNFLGLLRRRRILNPFRYPLLSIALISHKLLRWLSPAILLALLILSGLLGLVCAPYAYLFSLQIAAYALATVGLVAGRYGVRLPVLSQLGSFVWANLGMLWGLASLMSGRRIHAYGGSGSC